MGASIPGLKMPEGNDASAVLRHDTAARFFLGIFVVLQFTVLVAYIVYTGRQFAGSELILGAEIGFVSIVLNFFYGSSAGSVTKSAKGEKTETTSSP